MRQFRNLPIFISASATGNSWGLPLPAPVVPLYGVRPGPISGLPDAISGAGGQAYDYETRVLDVLDELTDRATGRLLLSLLPPTSPVVVTELTAADTKRLGVCNAEAGWRTELEYLGFAISGYEEIVFSPNTTHDCVDRGPASQPHEILFHELVHAYEDTTHLSHANVKLTGDVGQYFDDMAEFASILITNIYISETPHSDLRYHHHSHARLPNEYATSKGFLRLRGVVKALEYMRSYDQRLVNMIATLTEPGFNPLREFVNGEYDLTPSDWLPVEGRP